MTGNDDRLRAAKERCWRALHEHFDLLREDDPENTQIYDMLEQSNRDNMEQQPWSPSTGSLQLKILKTAMPNCGRSPSRSAAMFGTLVLHPSISATKSRST